MDYPGTQDNTIFSGAGVVNYNHGDSPVLYNGYYNSTVGTCRAHIAFDFKSFNDDYPDAVIDAVRLVMKPSSVSATGNTYIYATLMPWGVATGNWEVNEGIGTYDPANTGEPTWNCRTYATNWNSTGADAETADVHGDAAGDYGGTDDKGEDYIGIGAAYTSLALVTATFSSLGVDVVSTQIKNDDTRYGFLLKKGGDESTTLTSFHSSEYDVDTDLRPYLEVDCYLGTSSSSSSLSSSSSSSHSSSSSSSSSSSHSSSSSSSSSRSSYGLSQIEARAALNTWGTPPGADWDVYEGDKNRAAATAGEPNYTYAIHNTLTWNEAGANLEDPGFDGTETWHYNIGMDVGDAPLGETSVIATGWHIITLNATGLEALTTQVQWH